MKVIQLLPELDSGGVERGTLELGKYLVADPISEAGVVTMSRAQLKAFFTRWGGTGTAVFDRDWNL